MKLDRMMAILTLLQEQEWLQAPDLAARFEVSVRTIYRDVDALNLAGIPIESRQGHGGGIRVMPGFKLDKTLLTERDLTDVVTALKSLSTAFSSNADSVLLEKLNHSVPVEKKQSFAQRTNEVIIDISPWGDDARIRTKLNLIRALLDANRTLAFQYRDAQGRTSRRVLEPHTLLFKGMNWYVYGWCRKSQDFRTFRLSRMIAPEDGGETFQRRDISTGERPWHTTWTAPENNITLVMRFPGQYANRLSDWFEPEDLAQQANGDILVRSQMPDTPWVDSFVLGFGAMGEVLEPAHIRERIQNTLCDMVTVYGCADRMRNSTSRESREHKKRKKKGKKKS